MTQTEPDYVGMAYDDLSRMNGTAGWIVGRAGTEGPTVKNLTTHVDGVQIKLPVPLMYEHRLAIGWVRRSVVAGDAVDIEAEVCSPDETRDPILAKRLRQAWSEIRDGRITGLSWRYRPIDEIAGDAWSSMLREVSVTSGPLNKRACITDILLRAEPPAIKRKRVENVVFLGG